MSLESRIDAASEALSTPYIFFKNHAEPIAAKLRGVSAGSSKLNKSVYGLFKKIVALLNAYLSGKMKLDTKQLGSAVSILKLCVESLDKVNPGRFKPPKEVQSFTIEMCRNSLIDLELKLKQNSSARSESARNLFDLAKYIGVRITCERDIIAGKFVPNGAIFPETYSHLVISSYLFLAKAALSLSDPDFGPVRVRQIALAGDKWLKALLKYPEKIRNQSLCAYYITTLFSLCVNNASMASSFKGELRSSLLEEIMGNYSLGLETYVMLEVFGDSQLQKKTFFDSLFSVTKHIATLPRQFSTDYSSQLLQFHAKVRQIVDSSPILSGALEYQEWCILIVANEVTSGPNVQHVKQVEEIGDVLAKRRKTFHSMVLSAVAGFQTCSLYYSGISIRKEKLDKVLGSLREMNYVIESGKYSDMETEIESKLNSSLQFTRQVVKVIATSFKSSLRSGRKLKNPKFTSKFVRALLPSLSRMTDSRHVIEQLQYEIHCILVWTCEDSSCPDISELKLQDSGTNRSRDNDVNDHSGGAYRIVNIALLYSSLFRKLDLELSLAVFLPALKHLEENDILEVGGSISVWKLYMQAADLYYRLKEFNLMNDSLKTAVNVLFRTEVYEYDDWMELLDFILLRSDSVVMSRYFIGTEEQKLEFIAKEANRILLKQEYMKNERYFDIILEDLEEGAKDKPQYARFRVLMQIFAAKFKFKAEIMRSKEDRKVSNVLKSLELLHISLHALLSLLTPTHSLAGEDIHSDLLVDDIAHIYFDMASALFTCYAMKINLPKGAVSKLFNNLSIEDIDIEYCVVGGDEFGVVSALLQISLTFCSTLLLSPKESYFREIDATMSRFFDASIIMEALGDYFGHISTLDVLSSCYMLSSDASLYGSRFAASRLHSLAKMMSAYLKLGYDCLAKDIFNSSISEFGGVRSLLKGSSLPGKDYNLKDTPSTNDPMESSSSEGSSVGLVGTIEEERSDEFFSPIFLNDDDVSVFTDHPSRSYVDEETDSMIIARSNLILVNSERLLLAGDSNACNEMLAIVKEHLADVKSEKDKRATTSLVEMIEGELLLRQGYVDSAISLLVRAAEQMLEANEGLEDISTLLFIVRTYRDIGYASMLGGESKEAHYYFSKAQSISKRCFPLMDLVLKKDLAHLAMLRGRLQESDELLSEVLDYLDNIEGAYSSGVYGNNGGFRLLKIESILECGLLNLKRSVGREQEKEEYGDDVDVIQMMEEVEIELRETLLRPEYISECRMFSSNLFDTFTPSVSTERFKKNMRDCILISDDIIKTYLVPKQDSYGREHKQKRSSRRNVGASASESPPALPIAECYGLKSLIGKILLVKNDAYFASGEIVESTRGYGDALKHFTSLDFHHITEVALRRSKAMSSTNSFGSSLEAEQYRLLLDCTNSQIESIERMGLNFGVSCLSMASSQVHSSPPQAVAYIHLSMGTALRHRANQLLLNSEKTSNDIGDVDKRLDKLSFNEPRRKRGKKAKVIEDDEEINDEIEIEADRRDRLKNWISPSSDGGGLLRFCQLLPDDWVVCTISMYIPYLPLPTPNGTENLNCSLVISRITKNNGPVVRYTHIPFSGPAHSYLSIMKEYNRIMQVNSDLISEVTDVELESANKRFIRKHWSEKYRLSEDLHELLYEIQEKWLGGDTLLLSGVPSVYSTRESVHELAMRVTKLSNFLSNSDVAYLIPLIISWNALSDEAKVAAVDSILQDSSDEILDEEGESLISLILETIEQSDIVSEQGIAKEIGPVILILDERLHAIPFENIPFLFHRAVSRAPSIDYIRSHISNANGQQTVSRLIDIRKSFYLLNPSRDLPNTQKKFLPIFRDALSFKGIDHHEPERDELLSEMETNDLFIFCGHNAAEKYFRRESLEALGRGAATFLFGCHSCRLVPDGDFEPNGFVNSYLLAGCPMVLGNLWDVTEMELDRFTELLLKCLYDELKLDITPEDIATRLLTKVRRVKTSNRHFSVISVPQKVNSLLHATSIAKQNPLIHLTRYAVVCYGIPLVVNRDR